MGRVGDTTLVTPFSDCSPPLRGVPALFSNEKDLAKRTDYVTLVNVRQGLSSRDTNHPVVFWKPLQANGKPPVAV